LLAFPTAATSAPFDAPQFLRAFAGGSRILFTTTEPLVPADTDSDYDIYQRYRGRTKLISTSPYDGGGCCFLNAYFNGASADGRKVFFSTFQRLAPADTDLSTDIYERFRGHTTLVSAGEINGNGNDDAHFNDVSADGGRVFFTTAEQLVPADTNCCDDAYERSGGKTTLISKGPGNGFLASFGGISVDGRIVLFGTAEALVPADTDSSFDLYRRYRGRTTLVSRGRINGNGDFNAFFAGASADARRVFFSTDERLLGADTDDAVDVYRRYRGRTSLVSAGRINGNGDFDAGFYDASRDGRRAFFHTAEPLVPADTDTASDVYERYRGRTILVSAGRSAGGTADYDWTLTKISTGGSRALLETAEPLDPADTDTAYDVYQRAFGATTLLSRGQINGNGDYDAIAEAASSDGRRVFFRTAEALVPADTDSALDEYERFRGRTTLITVGINPGALYPFLFDGVTADGRQAFFATDSALVPADTDNRYDLYERSGQTTTLITTPTPNLTG
jgi:hypothetical protein